MPPLYGARSTCCRGLRSSSVWVRLRLPNTCAACAKPDMRRRGRLSATAQLSLGDGLPHLLCSYHPSLQNTNTGRLTPAMMDDVLAQAKALFRSTSA